MIVCDVESHMCMVHRCENCPGKNQLVSFFQNKLLESEEDADADITFSQWQTTDRDVNQPNN